MTQPTVQLVAQPVAQPTAQPVAQPAPYAYQAPGQHLGPLLA
ncbi:hypothetical protein AB0H40_28655 [Streptomyces filamentosus]